MHRIVRLLPRLLLAAMAAQSSRFVWLDGLALAGLGLLVGSLPIYDFVTDPNHFVHRVPSAILAASLMLLAFFSLGVGLILNSINLRLLEVEKLVTRR